MKNLTRKMISAVLSVLLVGGMAICVSAADVKFGDVDNNGVIDSADALAVLGHSIEKNILEEDAFLRADVNGDKKVDSSDALDILCYSVGLIDTFDVCPSKKPATQNEILAYYSQAVEKAKNEKPRYLLDMETKCLNANVTIKDPLNILKSSSGMSATEMAKEMEKELLESGGTVSTVVAKDSYNSYANLPALCTLKDASKLKSITLTELKNGNYRIDIKLNDAKNPSANSAVCKVMGVADYDTVLEELKNEADIEGAEGMTKVALDELSYKNLWITCEINPANKQLVNYEMNADIYNASTLEVFAVVETLTIKTKATTSTLCKYSNFTY